MISAGSIEGGLKAPQTLKAIFVSRMALSVFISFLLSLTLTFVWLFSSSDKSIGKEVNRLAVREISHINDNYRNIENNFMTMALRIIEFRNKDKLKTRNVLYESISESDIWRAGVVADSANNVLADFTLNVFGSENKNLFDYEYDINSMCEHLKTKTHSVVLVRNYKSSIDGRIRSAIGLFVDDRCIIFEASDDTLKMKLLPPYGSSDYLIDLLNGSSNRLSDNEIKKIKYISDGSGNLKIDERKIKTISNNKIYEEFEFDNESYNGLVIKLSRLNYYLVVGIKKDDFYKSIYHPALIVILVIFICIVFSVIYCFGLFGIISRDVENLYKEIRKINSGTLSNNFKKKCEILEFDKLMMEAENLDVSIKSRDRQVKDIFDGSSMIGMIWLDLEMNIVHLNFLAESILSWTKNEISGSPISSLFYSHDEINSSLSNILNKDSSQLFELKIKNKNDELKIFQCNSIISKGIYGDDIIVLTFIDITDFQRDIKEITNYENYSLVGFMNSFCPISVLSINKESNSLKYLNVNIAWEKLTGHSRFKILGKNHFDSGILALSDSNKVFKSISNNGFYFSPAMNINKSNGEKLKIIVVYRKIRIQEQDVVISTVFDIEHGSVPTNQLESSISKYEYEISNLKSFFEIKDIFYKIELSNLKKQNNQRIDIARSVFFEIFEEIRNRLYSVNKILDGISNYINKNELSIIDTNLLKSNVRVVDYDIKDSISFINEIPNVFSNRMNQDIDFITFNKMVEIGFNSIFGNKNERISLNLDIENNLIIKKNSSQFFRIICSLMMNSLVHGFPEETRGSISISAGNKNGKTGFIYRDDGMGIGSQSLSFVFDKEFRINSEEGYTGYTLFEIRKIIQDEFNGEIQLLSDAGVGTVIIIEIENN